MMSFKLPKERSINANDPSWIRSLKEFCNDIVRALRVIRQLRGDGTNIRVDGEVIRWVGSSGATQFYPTLNVGAGTVTTNKGFVAVASRGRWATPSTTVTLVGTSGFVVVRKAKASPVSVGAVVVLPSPGEPNPVGSSYYEWTICSYALNDGVYSIDDISPGEKEWYATL